MVPVMQGILLLLVIAVIFVNGWTDAPNAITSAVSTGAISYRKAVRLAAGCNLLGIVAMSLVSTSVADTMLSIARFDPANPVGAIAALCAAMASIVLFAVAAWMFGIPTSESHALIAALTGASLALGGSSGVENAAWQKVLWGLAISVGAGMLLGWLAARLLTPLLLRCSGRRLDRLQIAAAGGMAFLHGAQDGQKFIAVLVMVDLLAKGTSLQGPVDIRDHWLAMLLCGAVMAAGTAVGGKRIIAAVGEKMVPLQKHQGVCADLAGGICLLAASLTGIPMSTTHTKTTAVMGVGLAGKRGTMNFSVMAGILLAWAVTFPACGLLGWLLTRFFVSLWGG